RKMNIHNRAYYLYNLAFVATIVIFRVNHYVFFHKLSLINATRNSDSLITDLDMEFKRKRQAKITNEIIEIVSGADAV
ncbi:F0F1 ATP synthase subunit gamma, partial [Mycoplasmopsis bovis]|uniref:F0F1 ATP synthase subunit gamma n=1 Tax=Mycoplasmopsis bovis TaxID=28903 RepID=UPI003D2CC9FB